MNKLNFSRRSQIVKMGNWLTDFWHVSIDGKEIAKNAKPFAAADASIVLNECDYCGCCGWDDVKVRRVSDSTITWHCESVDEAIKTFLPAEQLFVFSKDAYEETLGGSADDLPELTQQEFQRIINLMPFPNWEDALYSLPEIGGDPFGKQTLRALTHAIGENKLQLVLATPDPSQKLAIGLDIDRHPEMEIEIAESESGTIFRFANLPALPFWMSLDSDEPFAKILGALG